MAQAVRAAIHWTVSLCLPVYMGWYWLGLVRYVNSALGGVLATLVRRGVVRRGVVRRGYGERRTEGRGGEGSAVRYVKSALGGVLATLVRAEERALQARPHHLLSRTAPGRGLLGKATWPAAPGQEPCVAA